MTGVHAFFPPSLSLSRDRSCGTPRLPYRGLIATTVPFFAVLLLIEGNRGPELRRGEDNKRIRAKLFEVTVLSSSSSLRDELFLLPFFFLFLSLSGIAEGLFMRRFLEKLDTRSFECTIKIKEIVI